MRVHINSTGTAALHTTLEPRLWKLFLATSGTPTCSPPHAGDKPPLDGISVYEEAMRTYGYRTLRRSAAVSEKVIGHLPLPEQVPLLPEW